MMLTDRAERVYYHDPYDMFMRLPLEHVTLFVLALLALPFALWSWRDRGLEALFAGLLSPR